MVGVIRTTTHGTTVHITDITEDITTRGTIRITEEAVGVAIRITADRFMYIRRTVQE